ncbi:MAG: hypothetical protein M1814_002743 [Vezdaea aestivalis]|nr:MAG: hypothetical protein M1814_002743 [Vezdaea aestivalis]
MTGPPSTNGHDNKLRFIPLSYNNEESHDSALQLILTIRPDWALGPGSVEFTRFTDGITNTLLKAVKNVPGLTETQLDDEAILLRAYGNKTDVLIDRDREASSHLLLAQFELAPPLLARFKNGLLYNFVQGWVTTSTHLQKPKIWRAVATHLGEWHAVLPVVSTKQKRLSNGAPHLTARTGQCDTVRVLSGKTSPNIWTVMQKWSLALPASSESERQRNDDLRRELDQIITAFASRPGLGKNGLVLGHCDLLSANVIVHPKHPGRSDGNKKDTDEVVSFIDYEYATPAPAAFDIANHFAEWAGYECDFNALPTRSERRDFLQHYLRSYASHVEGDFSQTEQLQELCDQVDAFRGIPGFYWGIWALIQASISRIDFDYANYAQVRLGEYWAWKAEVSGQRKKLGQEQPLRERRWAQK